MVVGALRAGFGDPVRDAHRVFRSCLDALARPGLQVPFEAALDAPSPLTANSAAVLLALADYETRVFLDPALAKAPGVRAYVSFHTGARITEHPAEADFAVCAEPMRLPPLSAFKLGEADYPDRSTTLIVQVDELLTGEGAPVWSGPGIAGEVRFDARPMPEQWLSERNSLRASFPLGVDLIFVSHRALVGLPRSSRLAACVASAPPVDREEER